jgi:mannose-6-phosphate isomerase-like protein (cupin superfamily)
MAVVAVLALVFVVLVVDRSLLARRPPARLVPAPGDVFESRSEGFTQRILERREGRIWVETTLAPGAGGPPPHVHRPFDERVRVAEGTLHIDLADGTVVAPAGEEHLIPAGAPHRIHNPTSEPTVLRGPIEPEYGLPEDFGVFLAQAYGYFDESPRHARPPGVLLQMSRWAPRFDTWMAGPPIVIQRVLYRLIGPIAAALGYRAWYERFAPRSAGPAPGRGAE